MAQPTASSSQSIRRHDIDWLRVLAVLLLVPFHGALVFVQDPHSIVYLKDTANSVFLDGMDSFIHQWHMPVLFILAGMSTCFALARRTAGQYLRERVFRLLIPLLFGIAVLVPPMTYLTQVSHGKSLTFWQHYARFFSFSPDLSGIQGTFTPAHLWFILFLVVYSVVGLPLFLWLKRKDSRAVVQGMAGFFEKPLALLLLGIPLALGAATAVMGDQNPIYYFLVFLVGFLLTTDEHYQRRIDRDWPILLGLGLVIETLRRTWFPAYSEWSLPWVLYRLGVELNRWVWALAILGAGHRYLNRGGIALEYLSEAAYPFYMLHFLVLTGVSYFVVQIQAAVAVKYLLILVFTFGATFLVYEGARRVAPLRFLLGMKARPKAAVEVRKGSVAQA